MAVNGVTFKPDWLNQRIFKLSNTFEIRIANVRQALASNKPSPAHFMLRRILKHDPDNIVARVLQVVVLLMNGQLLVAGTAAEALAEEPLGCFSTESLRELASVCFQLELFSLAVQLYSEIRDRGEPGELALYRLGIASLKLGLDQQAETCFHSCLERRPEIGATWLQLGHLYKIRGNVEQAETHYKRYIRLSPGKSGTGYWSLADMKNYRFSTEEIQTMVGELERSREIPMQASALSFALGRAAEQNQDSAQALVYYHRGNQLRQELAPFQKDHFCLLVEALQNINLDEQTVGTGDRKGTVTPIFIIGMPRSGTTLIEQILSSHSRVLATDELPFMERMALQLEVSGGYARALPILSKNKIAVMRAHYLNKVGAYLHDDCDFFIDKTPSNFVHVGLIKVLFPEALIIDSRRDPRDNAISLYRQNFSVGNEFSSSFETIILYYEKYQEIMAHWRSQFADTVRLQNYENLVNNPDIEIAALLKFCGLLSEPACFEFYKNKRNITTPSVSQVTRPMYTSSIGQWRAFEALLEPEMAALGALELTQP